MIIEIDTERLANLGVSPDEYVYLLMLSRNEIDSSFKLNVDLDINNVRTTILNGGDLWWDLDNAKYEIPKGSGKHSIFAGSIMIGGVDETGNLKMAALTHRDEGADFWAGPIDRNTISTTSDICEEYNKHYKLNKKDIEEYVTAFIAGESPTVPPSMQNYPAHGDIGAGHDYYLAPFFERPSVSPAHAKHAL